MPSIYEQLTEETGAYYDLYRQYADAYIKSRSTSLRHPCEHPRPPHKMEGGELASIVGNVVINDTFIWIPVTGPDTINFEGVAFSGESILFSLFNVHNDPGQAHIHTHEWGEWVEGRDKPDSVTDKRPLRLAERRALLFDLVEARIQLAKTMEKQGRPRRAPQKQPTTAKNRKKAKVTSNVSVADTESSYSGKLTPETLAELQKWWTSLKIPKGEGLIVDCYNPEDKALDEISLLITPDGIRWVNKEKDPRAQMGGRSIEITAVDDITLTVERHGFAQAGEEQAVTFLGEWERMYGDQDGTGQTNFGTKGGTLPSKARQPIPIIKKEDWGEKDAQNPQGKKSDGSDPEALIA